MYTKCYSLNRIMLSPLYKQLVMKTVKAIQHTEPLGFFFLGGGGYPIPSYTPPKQGSNHYT